MKFYIKPTQEHPNEKGEYALIQEGTLCLFTGQSYEETANEEKFKIAFNKLSSKQKEQDFIECEIDDKFKFKSLKIELQDTDNYEVNPINEADKQKGIIKPCLFEKAPCPLRFKRKKTGILIGLIKAYKQDKNKEFIDDISSLNNPHNEIYTIDIEQEIQLRAFVYEEQRTRVEKDKVTDSNTQQKRDYKEEQGNITKTIKDISNNEAQNIKWAFKLSNYDNIELNPLLQKDKKGFIRLNQSGDSIRFALKDILKDGQNINSLVDKTITFFAYVNSPTSKIYSELYQTNNSTRENERIVKQDRVTSIELKIIQTRFKLEFDGQTLQFLENERVMGEWNARSGVAIENKINNAEIKPKNRASVYLSQADKNKSFYYDDPKNTQDFLPEIEDNESYFVTVPLDKRAYMLASSTKTSDLASYLSSVTPLSLDFFNLAISKQDDKNSLQVVAQIDNHQFKTKQEDNNNKNINLGYSYDDFIQTLLAHINSKETIDIPLNVKYQKRILITIERFKETTESTMSKMNIFIDGKRVDSKGNFIEKLTTKGTKEYEMFNPFSLPNDENNYAYILERNGPDCIGGELKLRIPEGRYNVSWYDDNNAPNFQKNTLNLKNSFVHQDRHILIHDGFSPKMSDGCLLIKSKEVRDKDGNMVDNILDKKANKSRIFHSDIQDKLTKEILGKRTNNIKDFVKNYVEVRVRNVFEINRIDIALKFDGEFLSILINGKMKHSFQAVSGEAQKMNDKYYFTYEKERQMLKNEGPIPEGEYFITPLSENEDDSIQVLKPSDEFVGLTSGAINSLLQFATLPTKKFGKFYGGSYAWGKTRIPIQPKIKIIINSQGKSVIRDNFFIHGGISVGSAGCIDLWKNNDDFFKVFLEYVEKHKKDILLNQGKIPLTVKYKNNIKVECDNDFYTKQCQV